MASSASYPKSNKSLETDEGFLSLWHSKNLLMTSVSHVLGQVSPQIIQLQWRHGAALILILVLTARVWRSYWRLKAMPPGPRGFPIIGNLLQMPVAMQWFKFSEWGKKYGTQVFVSLYNQLHILCVFLTDVLIVRADCFSQHRGTANYCP